MKCCFLSCLNTEFHLRVNLGFASFIRLHISSIRLQDMSFYIILKLQIKYMLQLFLNLLIFHRENNLYPAVKVTRHPIRTSHIDFRVSAVFKIENTTMLQKFPYNRTDMNILTDSRHSYFQTADTPYQKLHLNSAGRCIIQSSNNLRITERIHLCAD